MRNIFSMALTPHFQVCEDGGSKYVELRLSAVPTGMVYARSDAVVTDAEIEVARHELLRTLNRAFDKFIEEAPLARS